MFFIGVLLSALPVLASAICPELCTCDDVNLVVTCVKSGLDVIPNTLNPRLKTLVYKYNDLPTVHFSLSFLRELQKVDLSHNKIVTVSDRAFGGQRGLHQLSLEGNSLGDITNLTFAGLRSLKVLNLRGNLLGEVRNGAFSHSSQLVEIDLAKNRISAIGKDAFKGLSALRILNLESNALSTIPVDAFSHLPDLAELNLAGNPIGYIQDGALVNFRTLVSLDLSSCRIARLERGAFRGLGSLRGLKIADNNLTHVPVQAFGHLPGLESLDIGRNPFKTIEAGSFRHLPKLKRIDISGCGKLTAIRDGAFGKCRDFEQVTISQNLRLTTIGAGAFDAVPKLVSLDLSMNRLPTLPEDLVPWTQLDVLSLFGNPWRCDCDLVFLNEMLKFMEAAQIAEATEEQVDVDQAVVRSEINAGKCAEPAILRHQSLLDVQLDCNSINYQDMIRHEPMMEGASVHNPTSQDVDTVTQSTIILIASVALSLLVFSLLLLLALRYGSQAREWAKESIPAQWLESISRRQGSDHMPYKGGMFASPGAPVGTLRHSSDIVDPYLRYPQQSQEQPFYHSHQEYRKPSYSINDEHYYYVATLQNSSRLSQGKHIPVTEL